MAVKEYIANHLADEAWHREFFDFVTDRPLAKRLAEEFLSARYLYKLLEGLEADDWLLTTQVKVQVLIYASIYEATLHHLLFERYAERQEVKALLLKKRYVRCSIPPKNHAEVEKLLHHDGRQLVPMYIDDEEGDVRTVKFEDKAITAVRLGLISDALSLEIVEVYSARNAIHLHAELRRNVNYDLELSRMAYRRMQVFREQILEGIMANPPTELDIANR
jgi:hypothetical protein